jgi:antitoxin component YwqK of YwqJK toxin-antitoxin module
MAIFVNRDTNRVVTHYLGGKLRIYETFLESDKNPIEASHELNETYYSNGALCTRKNLVDGKYESWHDNGQKCYICKYRGDKENGECLLYYRNGLLKEMGVMLDGMWDGVYGSWHPNGTPLCVANYRDGKLNGEYKLWYDDGNPHCRWFYVDGLLHGNCITYTRAGQIVEHVKYQSGNIQRNYLL